MTDQELDPAVKKLIEYGKSKNVLSWDEINEILPCPCENEENQNHQVIHAPAHGPVIEWLNVWELQRMLFVTLQPFDGKHSKTGKQIEASSDG